MLMMALFSYVPSILVVVPFLGLCAAFMLIRKPLLKRIVAVTFNIWAIFALLFVCGALVFWDHSAIANIVFWVYFGFYAVAMVRIERTAGLPAIIMAFVCCFAAFKVTELAASSHVQGLRADARQQMPVQTQSVAKIDTASTASTTPDRQSSSNDLWK